ncbi:MAG: monovalent cation/H(+) antiporter subunit G [Bdellovibrionales bacterium]|nr:monovalent cation/H(+) antiporter subunit G [Bdellovibrionales bacterium]
MNLFVYILFLLGFFFTFVGIIGILRLPNFFARLHAVGKSDTLGVSLMLLALAVHIGWNLTGVKVLFILVFFFIVNPIVAHALGRSAVKSGLSSRNQELL